VTKKQDVAPVLKAAFKSKNTSLIDFRVAPEANVMPMVPKGASLDEMIENWEEER
jgi:acetolactate synthase I/II/III large subunit